MSKHYLIQLIAPSGYCLDQTGALEAVSYLTSLGFELNSRVLSRQDRRFAGTINERLTEINTLPETALCHDIVMVVRGGYGASQLLAEIDYPAFRSAFSSKVPIICGHSDFTAIQLALLAQAQCITFSGPMLYSNYSTSKRSAFTHSHLINLITQSEYQIHWQAKTATQGEWEGTLWGGNLTLIASLIGTPFLPKIEKGILVIEDINEPPYKIERIMLQLHYAGILANQQLIIAGDFSGNTDPNYDKEDSFASVWRMITALSGIPVLTGLNFGHEKQTVTLPIGAKAKVTAEGIQCHLQLSEYPTLNASTVN